MELTDSSPTFFTRRSTWWIVGVIAAVLFATANLPWQLDEYSQERQALASFQMIKDGRWFYQEAPRTHREEREATKPPLIPWISAATFAITRSWNFAWRYPAALGAFGLTIALFLIARKTFNLAAAFFAVCAFAFNTITPRLATLVRTDMSLAFVVFLVGAQILEHVRTRMVWTPGERFIICAFLMLGLFIKGPIVYLFLLPGIISYHWLGPNERSRNVWPGWWPWLASLGIFLAWVAGGIFSRPKFYDDVVVHEFFGRLSTTEQGPHAIHYYATHLLQKFAPWSELLLLLSILSFMQDRQSLRRAVEKFSPTTWWVVCWSLGGLIVMSLVPSKRLDRIFPIIPPLCLLIGAQFQRRTQRWFGLTLAIAIGLTTSYFGYVKIYRGYRNQRNSLSIFGEEVRRAAKANGWHYEVTPAHDGALLLYLDRTQFVEMESAIEMWNANQIDALVVEAADLPQIQPRLKDVILSDLRATEHIDKKQRGYVLVRRGEL